MPPSLTVLAQIDGVVVIVSAPLVPQSRTFDGAWPLLRSTRTLIQYSTVYVVLYPWKDFVALFRSFDTLHLEHQGALVTVGTSESVDLALNTT